ncbi:hypothetical protein PG994_007041 [Apiospora phragmitis]|uniref:Uncharacterized protein n=1 Tax=Apiospora phragmitis TaxID=2905665 RepID=A0ABR1UZS6_9PEZI
MNPVGPATTVPSSRATRTQKNGAVGELSIGLRLLAESCPEFAYEDLIGPGREDHEHRKIRPQAVMAQSR